MKLAADTVQAGSIARIAMELLDSGAIKMNQVKPGEASFIQAAGRLLPAIRRNQSANEYDAGQLLSLLGKFKTPAANAMLTNYLSIKSTWLKQTAAIELIKNNQPTPIAVLNNLAADKTTRYSLYTDLKEINKKKLFPVQWLTRQNFAEAAAYSAATDEDNDEGDNYRSLAFLYKKTARYKNKSYVFYLYKVMYNSEDGPAAYLGIAGGYQVGGTDIEPELDLSGVYRQKTLDAKNGTTLLTDYLAELEKNSEPAPED